jgi:hypothetical protein
MDAKSVIEFYRVKSDEAMKMSNDLLFNAKFYSKKKDYKNIKKQYDDSCKVIEIMQGYIFCLDQFKIMYNFTNSDLKHLTNNLSNAISNMEKCKKVSSMKNQN